MTSAASRRREKKQRQKERSKVNRLSDTARNDTNNTAVLMDEVEYVPEMLDEKKVGEDFENVIKKFAFIAEDEEDKEIEEQEAPSTVGEQRNELYSDDEEPKVSKRQQRKQSRMSLAALKQFCAHPEVVEWEDVTSPDPLLLCQLKSMPHTVPVPRHWSQKRKYLSGKRGYVKPPFQLPSFIRDTGVTEVRDAMRKEDGTKRTKVKAREKMHPKLARLSVDYEKLYDAFFKYQTKPPLTPHGDLYYEGKEFMGAIAGGVGTGGAGGERKPGILSEELKAALGITSHIMPPPWLHAMQKYGPPPSYPHMRIPGLNAPIPEGAQWGYHPGGWGKPPVDDPTMSRDRSNPSNSHKSIHPIQTMLLKPIENNLWGELLPEEDEETEEYEEAQGEVQETVDIDNEEIEDHSGDKVYVKPAVTSKMSHHSADPDEIVLVKHRK